MLKGPKGEKRPTDSNVNAVLIAKIATGEITEEHPKVMLKISKSASQEDAPPTGLEPATS